MVKPRLTAWDRLLLFLPIPGAIIFGLSPYLFPDAVARSVGFTGNDPYVLRLASSGTFAFAIALGAAIVQGEWLPARFVAVATVVFTVLAVPVCLLVIAAGPAPLIVYAFLADSILQVVALGWLLLRYRGVQGGEPDDLVPVGVVGLLAATVIGTVVGLVALLVPHLAAQVFGYSGTDDLIYRLGGAETLGYAVMGFLMWRSRNWSECRLPVLLVVGFTGLALIATLIAFSQGGPILMPSIVLLVTIVVTPAGLLALIRGPVLSSPTRARSPKPSM